MKEILVQLRTSHFWLVMASFGLLVSRNIPGCAGSRTSRAEIAEAIQGAKVNPAHDHLNALLDESQK